jgi:hypothetical protein
MMNRCAAVLTALVFAFATASASAQSTVMKDPTQGTPQLKSIEAIGFAPGGILLVGDGKGKQIVAIDTRDTTPIKWTNPEIKNIKDALAGPLGTTAKDIEIRKIAVNPESQTVYCAIRGLAMKKDTILTIDGNGKVSEFKMEAVPYVAVPLPSDQKITMITNIVWAGDRALVSAQASDATFGNAIFSAMAPLGKEGSCGCFTTDTYHVAHSKWETKAPIRTIIPYEQNGKKYLVGAFTCTPIVKYSLEDLQAGAKVKGVSVIELGYGNTPQSMFTYEKNGKRYILMNQMRMAGFQKSDPVGPSEYWTARVDYDILQETDKINERALQRTAKGKASQSSTDRAIVVASFHGVMLMDRLDADRALVIRKDDKGAVNLQVLPLP